MIDLSKTTKLQSLFLIGILFLAILAVYGVINQNYAATPVYCSNSPVISNQPIIENDSNWAGYIAASDLLNPSQTVTQINASWTIPQVTVSENDSFSAIWIGVGGFFDRSLIQVGSEQDSINGQAVYDLWYEVLPNDAVTLDALTVVPGANITASLALINPNTGLWQVTVSNGTEQFQGTIIYPSSQNSAEWIFERPTVNQSLATLANISSLTYTNCTATINNQTGPINSYPFAQLLMFQGLHTSDNSTQLAYVSNLTDNGSSFKVTTYNPEIPEFSSWIAVPIFLGTLTVLLLKKFSKQKYLQLHAN